MITVYLQNTIHRPSCRGCALQRSHNDRERMRMPRKDALSGVATKSTFRGRERPIRAEARKAEPGVRVVLGQGAVSPLPTRWCDQGSAISSLSGVWGEAPAAKSVGAFWVVQSVQVSSPAVLLGKTMCVQPIWVYDLMHFHATHNSFKIYPVQKYIISFE